MMIFLKMHGISAIILEKGRVKDTIGKIFNVNVNCIPKLHYMVGITDRLRQVRSMVDDGQYFANGKRPV